MNIDIFNLYFKKLSKELEEISALKKEINQFETTISEKKARNENAYNSLMADLVIKENSIKTLMENKHFSFIKYLDLIDDRDIKSISGMELHDSLGFLTVEKTNRTAIEEESKVQSSDKLSIYFTFNDSNYSNEIEYSFKNENGLPNVPSSIKIEHDDYTSSFFEPNFRYYNRNRADIFTNTYYFHPKKISKVIFEFDEPPVLSSGYCKLYACEYDTSEGSNVVFDIVNEKKLNSFNLYKTTDEDYVPLLFSYSEDNITYNDITFSGREAVILLVGNGDFTIKVKPDYSNIYQKEETEVVSEIIPRSSMTRSKGITTFSLEGTPKDFDIIFSYSAYNLLKSKLEQLSSEIKIDDLIQIEDSVYKVKKNFIITTDKITDKEKKLMYFDDVAILAEDISYFTFTLDKNNNALYYPEFMEEFTFYGEIKIEQIKEKIDDSLITPYIFDLSLKG
jgi:hypothetical protein